MDWDNIQHAYDQVTQHNDSASTVTAIALQYMGKSKGLSFGGIELDWPGVRALIFALENGALSNALTGIMDMDFGGPR